MTDVRRRQLLLAGSAVVAGSIHTQRAQAAMGPNDKFDLLVRNANVLDPGSQLSGKRDIGIRYGVIESIEVRHGLPVHMTRVLEGMP